MAGVGEPERGSVIPIFAPVNTWQTGRVQAVGVACHHAAHCLPRVGGLGIKVSSAKVPAGWPKGKMGLEINSGIIQQGYYSTNVAVCFLDVLESMYRDLDSTQFFAALSHHGLL